MILLGITIYENIIQICGSKILLFNLPVVSLIYYWKSTSLFVVANTISIYLNNLYLVQRANWDLLPFFSSRRL